MPHPRFQFLICLLVYTLIVRVLPYILMNCDITVDPSVLYYPWNFSPLTAVCLFGGAFLVDRRVSFLLPLATLFVSDIGIALVSGHMDWGFPVTPEGTFTLTRLGRWALTYVGFAAAVAMGMLLRAKQIRKVGPAVAMGLTFEVAFFLISNFIVWTNFGRAEDPLYPMNAAGLLQCYYFALPFVTKSLLGTTAFTLLLFSPIGIRAATEPEAEPVTGELIPVHVK